MEPILDCHVHIFPDRIAAKAVQSIGRYYDLPMAGTGLLADMLAARQAAGITHCVLFATATRPDQVLSINRFMADCCSNRPGLTALGTVHPGMHEKDADEALDQLEALGLSGIKLHPDFQNVAADDPFVIRMARRLRPGQVLLLHAGDPNSDLSHPARIRRLAEACSGTAIVAAHLGGYSLWRQAVRLLAGCPNVWVDTSSSLPFLEADEAADIMRDFGLKRVLFGTDYPMWSPNGEIRRLNSLPLAETEKQAVLWSNGARLFQLEPIA
jgi:predicted TIM-barrel fold metal-dependent hydrolase